jgi:hypothetical protein
MLNTYITLLKAQLFILKINMFIAMLGIGLIMLIMPEYISVVGSCRIGVSRASHQLVRLKTLQICEQVQLLGSIDLILTNVAHRLPLPTKKSLLPGCWQQTCIHGQAYRARPASRCSGSKDAADRILRQKSFDLTHLVGTVVLGEQLIKSLHVSFRNRQHLMSTTERASTAFLKRMRLQICLHSQQTTIPIARQQASGRA